MLQIFQLPVNHLVIHIVASLSLSLLLAFVHLPVLLLQGLHTYIHPDSTSQKQNGGAKAAIRRPSSGSDIQSELRKRTSSGPKSKDRSEFDEANAQIFRLSLDVGHLQTRLFFNDYRYCFIYSSLAMSNMVLYKLLRDGTEKNGILEDGSSIVVTIFGIVSLSKNVLSLGKIFWEKSAYRSSEKQWSFILGFLGFCLGLLVFSGVARSVLDFDLGDFNSVFGKVFFAFLMGCLAGFLFVPAGKNARSFWLGTDQLRSNLDILSCGRISRFILYANLLFGIFTPLLWVNQVNSILILKSHELPHSRDSLTGNVGFKDSDFHRIRIFCLMICGFLQLVSLRQNIQMFLNEALLSWYQRLHSSKSPDLAFSRAKVFLHNHFLCASVLQFLSPPLLLLAFLGLSQMNAQPWLLTSFLQNSCLLMAWWVSFIWAAFTLVHLSLYRHGFVTIS